MTHDKEQKPYLAADFVKEYNYSPSKLGFSLEDLAVCAKRVQGPLGIEKWKKDLLESFPSEDSISVSPETLMSVLKEKIEHTSGVSLVLCSLEVYHFLREIMTYKDDFEVNTSRDLLRLGWMGVFETGIPLYVYRDLPEHHLFIFGKGKLLHTLKLEAPAP